MSTVQEIESAIRKLPPGELGELYSWLEEYSAHLVDAQFTADLDAGRMDALIDNAIADHDAGNTRPL